MEFQAGLRVVNVNDYILIKEVDAIALNYGYSKAINNQLDTPRTVLFMGVGFAATQLFIARFTATGYEIKSCHKSLEVSSSKMDELYMQIAMNDYMEEENESEVSKKYYPTFYEVAMKAKKHTCYPSM